MDKMNIINFVFNPRYEKGSALHGNNGKKCQNHASQIVEYEYHCGKYNK